MRKTEVRWGEVRGGEWFEIQTSPAGVVTGSRAWFHYRSLSDGQVD